MIRQWLRRLRRRPPCNFLMLPTEPFALVAAQMDDPSFVALGRLPHWGNAIVYACNHECTCLFVVDADTSEYVYPDRFAGMNCRDTTDDGHFYLAQECPCHTLSRWPWAVELEDA